MASREWRILKREALTRQSVCSRCNSAAATDLHHLTYQRRFHESSEDLQAVCRDCHRFLSALTDIDPQEVRAESPRRPHYQPQWTAITPAMAMEFLERNTLNRKESILKQERMAADMETGSFIATHQGIAFDINGVLLDGQNRLRAIMRSGRPQWMLVTYDLPLAARAVIDAPGTDRKAHESLKLGYGLDIGKDRLAVARAMYRGLENKYALMLSVPELGAYVSTHEKAIVFAEEAVGKAVSVRSNVRAVVARAWYSQSHDRLRQFGAFLATGRVALETDSAAATCWKFLTQCQGGQGRAQAFEIYGKVNAALIAFCEHRPYSKVYMATRENFPVPGEEGAL